MIDSSPVHEGAAVEGQGLLVRGGGRVAVHGVRFGLRRSGADPGPDVRESQTITVAEVDRFSPEKGAIILKKIRDLKGESPAEPLKHQLVRGGETVVDLPLLEWAEPGRRCVLFVTGKAAVICVGEAWYQASAGDDGWWRIGAPLPDLPLAYYGTVSRLTEAVPLMIAGKRANHDGAARRRAERREFRSRP